MRFLNINLIFYFFLFGFCNQKLILKQNNALIIEITDINYSKIPPKYDKKLLSKITGLNQTFFSSGIEGLHKEKHIEFPINDKLFNHEYFNNYNYDKNKKAIIHLQKYIYKGQDYLIAIKIEDVK